jgi:hypothetical protein
MPFMLLDKKSIATYRLVSCMRPMLDYPKLLKPPDFVEDAGQRSGIHKPDGVTGCCGKPYMRSPTRDSGYSGDRLSRVR